MTRHPKRLMTAGILAVLLACGVPAAALADTDVVLYNESKDSEVHTGESTFSNSSATESKAATLDPPSEGQSVSSVQIASSAPSADSGQVRSVTPKVAVPVKTAVASATSKAVDSLFVGLSVGLSVGP